jgi:hypothetical protein
VPADESRTLESELGTPLPRGMSKLTRAQRADLASAVADAHRRQATALADAGEHALGLLPPLLRDAIRRLAR